MKLKKHSKNLCLGLLALASLCPGSIMAQDQWGKTGTAMLWQGIRERQPADEMPKGKAPFQIPVRKEKKNSVTKLIPTLNSNQWIISEGWELGEFEQVIESTESIFSPNFDTKKWYNATVPGTVLTTLVDQGVYPEPSYGLNNMAIPEDLAQKSWWYRTAFQVPADAKGKRLLLQFEGINYKAQVYLNGKKLGNINGAFMRGEFDVTDVAKKDGQNVLAVLILPPNNPGIAHEQTMKAGQGLNGGQLSLDGPTFIASMGWDWIPGIRDRNMGIWQDVKLQATGSVKIGDPHVITNLPLPDTTQAKVTILMPVKNLTNASVSGKASAKFEGVSVEKTYTLAANEEATLEFNPSDFPQLNLKKPRLWWPNGYGAPALYDLSLEAEANGILDVKKTRFGIRELSYEMMIHTADKGNHRVAYTPTDADNGGKPVFNYEKVMLVGDPKKNETVPTLQDGVSEAKVLTQLSNDDPVGQFLVFRVNGERVFIKGGTSGMDEMMKRVSREKMEPYFQLHKDANFNLIRNWTGENTEDLFYELADEYGLLVWNDFWITTDDTVDPNDHALFMKNATDVVKRYRMHPSIAIWCPRNEGFAPKGLEPQLNAMVAKEDPTRHYHGNSRFLNAVNSGPYGFIKDWSKYYTQFSNGFNTEFGAQAIPTANTIKKFIAPEDQWPINDVWAYHDLHHTTHFFGDFMGVVNSYGEAKSMEEFAKKAQMVSYDTWRAMIESWNSRMWDNTTGLILWMSHPAWPSMTWQTYTYDYETPGSYFGAKKAQEALHVQMNLHNDKVIILNNTTENLKGLTVSARFYDLTGKEVYTKIVKTDATANAKTDCFDAKIQSVAPMGLTLARIELRDRKGKIVSTNDYWKNWGDYSKNAELNNLETVKLNITSTSKAGKYLVTVANPTKTIATAVKLNARDKATGEIILPAYFTDGYFNLLPGEKRVVELTLPSNKTGAISISTDGYNIEQVIY